MKGLVIEIKNTGGKWLINGKQYKDCNIDEQRYFDQFTQHIKQNTLWQ